MILNEERRETSKDQHIALISVSSLDVHVFFIFFTRAFMNSISSSGNLPSLSSLPFMTASNTQTTVVEEGCLKN